MRRTLVVAAAGFSMTTLVGCANSPTGQIRWPTPTGTASITTTITLATPARVLGRWEVVRVANAGGVPYHAETVKRDATITFGADGSIHADDSVNNLDGRATLSGGHLRVTDATTSLVGLGPSAPAVRKDLQGAFGALMMDGRTAVARLAGPNLVVVTGTWELTLARPVEG